MLKILIADDEPIVRESIKKHIDWETLGFELVADCADGREAREAVDKFQPDVVITDICMPFVDGLELTRYIVQKYPRIRVVILTGYDEFEYAQQAVKLKAYDFILKPVTAKELRAILEKITQEIREENDRMVELSRLLSRADESMPLLRDRFLNRMLTEGMPEEKSRKECEEFDIQFEGDCYAVLVADSDGPVEENAKYAVYNICGELLSKAGNAIVFQNEAGNTVAILNDSGPDLLSTRLKSAAEEVRQVIESYLDFTVTVGISAVCWGTGRLHEAYREAMAALDQRFIQGSNRVLRIAVREYAHGDMLENRNQWIGRLCTAIRAGTPGEPDAVVDEIVRGMREQRLSVDRCYEEVQHIVFSVSDALCELGVSERELAANGLLTAPEAATFKTLSEVESWLKDYCRRAGGYTQGQAGNSPRRQARAAVEYLGGHYAEHDLSLAQVCRRLSMSISSFSAMFRSATGETFVEYLTRLRMRKAMELLKTTDLKTYEIADRVGYDDAHYFSIIFKKTCRMTPTEYREKLRGEQA